MTQISLHDFLREVICIYDEEQYSVRDNGAVLRHSRSGKRLRSADNQWSFGNPNSQNGYMYIGSVRIHRIVTTAFHGEPPTSEHVVDHIDTNRRNNRPENLRWLTRLENALLNPITVKRIELICGSIEAFLEDPSKLRDGGCDPNFEWMRKVTPQEAQACLERMHLWSKSDKKPSGNGYPGEWIFKPLSTQKPSHETSISETSSERAISKPTHESPIISYESDSYDLKKIHELEELNLMMSKTPGAAQREWRIPTEFPYCPQKLEEKPIAAYAVKLTVGAIFSRNHFSTSMVLEVAVTNEGQSIYVLCERPEMNAIKPWALAKVTFEDGLYVHASIGTFFTKEGAEKTFCLTRGLEWTGGDTFDDYC